jgi:capsular polysaccharide biosynthesis protein
VTSVAGYAPFEKRYANLKNHSHGRFCPPALQVIRDRIYSLTDGLSPKEWPSKVYLRRNSAARKITNEVEIERIFHKNGYFIISPENLNFLEQVAIFRNATDVVGSSGAALANLIFSQPTTGVCIFIARLEGTSYWYWQNLASSVTNRISYILGKSIEENDLHANFDIKIDDVIKYLRLSIDFN